MKSILPPREIVANHLVARIPFVSPRMAAYQALGVRFEQRSRAIIMLRSEVWSPQRLEMGSGSIVGRGCLLDARGGIRLGRSANISSFVRMMTAKHDVQSPDFVAEYAPIIVGDRAWIALGATILGGVRIGEGAVVAAGSVVTRDVADFAIAAGVPARQVGERTRDLRYALDYRPNWI